MTSEAITLSQLIRQHQEKTGESYSVIARRAGLSKAKIGQLATSTTPPGPGQAHMPRADTLQKVAIGLSVPLDVVKLAAMTSAGVQPDGYGQRVDVIAAMLREMSPEDLTSVEMFAQALQRRSGIKTLVHE